MIRQPISHRITETEKDILHSYFLRKKAYKLTKTEKKPFLEDIINGIPPVVLNLLIQQLQTHLRNHLSDVQSRQLTGSKVHTVTVPRPYS